MKAKKVAPTRTQTMPCRVEPKLSPLLRELSWTRIRRHSREKRVPSARNAVNRNRGTSPVFLLRADRWRDESEIDLSYEEVIT